MGGPGGKAPNRWAIFAKNGKGHVSVKKDNIRKLVQQTGISPVIHPQN